jgi:hypothetical protein
MISFVKMLRGQRGIIMPTVILLILFLALTGLTLTDFVLGNMRAAQRLNYGSMAQIGADAGAEYAIRQLNIDETYAGTGGEQPLMTGPSSRYRVSYEATVSPGAYSSQKIVEATGRTYVPASAPAPKLVRKIRVYMQAGSSNFTHSVQTGTGPLYMYGNTGINGTLFTNNYIRMQDNATQIGGTIEIADRDTSNGCALADNGSATNSTILTNYPICGVTTTGSTVNTSAGVTTKPLPYVNREELLGGISANSSCTPVNSPTGPQPYPIPSAHYPDAGTGEEGDTAGGCNMILDGNKSYTISGDIHVRGDFLTDRNTITTTGSNDIYILVEGKLDIDRVVVAGPAPIIFVAYSPIDSNGDQTLPNALEIKGSNLDLNAYFLAPNGSIGFGGSTSLTGAIGAMAAKSVVMKGNAASTFLSVYPSSLNSRVWFVQEYQRVF